MKRVLEIQQKLKSPKDKSNTFGGFNYRTAAGIIEAVKPMLKQHNLVQVISDSLQSTANGDYVVPTVTLYDAEDGHIVTQASSLAQISEHKGMSMDQATGAASSYSRKYALCGLWDIDDSENDPDSLSRPDDIRKFLTENKAWIDWLKKKNFSNNTTKWDDDDLIIAGKLIKLDVEIQNNLKRTDKQNNDGKEKTI